MSPNVKVSCPSHKASLAGVVSNQPDNDPELSITTTSDCTQKVKGTIELLTNFAGDAGFYEEKFGFEVRYYIDYDFFRADNFGKGVKEFALELDNSTLKNGEHLISLNVDDHHDHIGSAGVNITVEN